LASCLALIKCLAHIECWTNAVATSLEYKHVVFRKLVVGFTDHSNWQLTFSAHYMIVQKIYKYRYCVLNYHL
jgi:hypothetical protein